MRGQTPRTTLEHNLKPEPDTNTQTPIVDEIQSNTLQSLRNTKNTITNPNTKPQ